MCTVPEVEDGVPNPSAGQDVDYGLHYTVTCNDGSILDSEACYANGIFASPVPACPVAEGEIFNYFPSGGKINVEKCRDAKIKHGFTLSL